MSDPPLKITWQSSFPEELKIADLPSFVIERKICELEAEPIASMATWIDPLVEFLKPTGHDKPEANSLWI